MNVVYFDYHADADPPPPGTANIRQQFRNQLPGEREFWQYVEWELSTTDSDWLKAGMDLGLIRDAILIGGADTALANNLDNSYTDVANQAHHIYNVGHVWDGLGDHGWLMDAIRTAQLQPIWDILGWGQVGGQYRFLDDRDDMLPFVLDFDLDCFTLYGAVGHVPWPSYKFTEMMTMTFDHGHVAADFRPGDFLQRLSGYAEFLTIARESPFCGGYRGSQQNLEQLDSLLFKGRLCPSF